MDLSQYCYISSFFLGERAEVFKDLRKVLRNVCLKCVRYIHDLTQVLRRVECFL